MVLYTTQARSSGAPIVPGGQPLPTCARSVDVNRPWMKEVKGIRHRGRGAYLRCPVFTTVQLSLHDEGSSEYICLCAGREILRPNFQTFQDPRHQFHGIGRLVSETLYLFATLALLHIQAELILGTFLPS
jgi:hypothetical protein